MKALQLLTKARAGLVLSSPFFASIALHLKLKEDLECETAYTDTVVLGYNPEFIERLTLSEVKAIICHEVLHVAMLHAFRKQGRIHKQWNMACDYAINPLILSGQYQLPAGALLDLRYQNLEAEIIYAMLSEEDEPQKDDLMIGDVREYQVQEDKEGYSIPVAQQQQNWKVKIAQAITAAKAAGKIPSGLELVVSEILQPKLCWEEILSRFVTENSRDDYSWKQPNRRYLYAGMYLPGINTPSLGTIAVIIDTSGSINQSELDRFSSELKSILSSYPSTKIEVIYVDSDVVHTETLDIYDFDLHAQGGGGTDFRPGFEYIEAVGIDPSCVLYFTDGYCNSFPPPPDYPTLWIITDYARFNPPFGEVVNIMGS